MNEYIDNLNGKNIALKANEYAKDKDPYRQEIEDLYAALWHLIQKNLLMNVGMKLCS